ncbi:MAG: hypothetical protein H6714_06685 [Myxococcales bacterium]|nr:hypothetical protein [Myxococcales bacterium]
MRQFCGIVILVLCIAGCDDDNNTKPDVISDTSNDTQDVENDVADDVSGDATSDVNPDTLPTGCSDNDDCEGSDVCCATTGYCYNPHSVCSGGSCCPITG